MLPGCGESPELTRPSPPVPAATLTDLLPSAVCDEVLTMQEPSGL
jgi:hypothetical protein